MSKDEVQKLVGEEVAKAMEPITKQLETIAKGEGEGADGSAPAVEPAAPSQEVTAEAVAKMVGEAVSKAMEGKLCQDARGGWDRHVVRAGSGQFISAKYETCQRAEKG